MHILLIEGYDAIRPKLNCFISMIISVAKLSGFPPLFMLFMRILVDVDIHVCTCINAEVI